MKKDTTNIAASLFGEIDFSQMKPCPWTGDHKPSIQELKELLARPKSYMVTFCEGCGTPAGVPKWMASALVEAVLPDVDFEKIDPQSKYIFSNGCLFCLGNFPHSKVTITIKDL